MPIIRITTWNRASFRRSIPTQRLPCFLAAMIVVAHPANGSSTRSPGLLLARMNALVQSERFLVWESLVRSLM